MKRTTRTHHADIDALQARIGLRLAARLTEQNRDLPSDISERLRVARDQAMQRARAARMLSPVAAPALSRTSSGSVALGPDDTPWWLRLVSATPLLLLLAGLLLIQHTHELSQIRAAAEVDADLLADDLPPDAYSDPGFFEFLKQRQP
jgi:hypothetical protein